MLAQTLQKRPKPGEKRRLSPGFRSHLPGFSGYQGQIRHGCGYQQLEQGFSPAEVTSLTDTQLHQARQAMLGGLPHLAIRLELGGVLKGPRLLQQSFLRMERDRAAPVGFGLDTLRAQQTGGAGLDRKGERLPGVLLTFLVQPKPSRDQGCRGVTRRAGAGHGLQIDLELALMDLTFAPKVGNLAINFRWASANSWRVLPSPYAQSPTVSSTSSLVLCSLASVKGRTGEASAALPGKTSTAVINWLSKSTAMPLCARQSVWSCSYARVAFRGHAPKRSDPG